METIEKKDNTSNSQVHDKKNNRYYKLLCILVVIFCLLFIVDIISNLTVKETHVQSKVYRLGKDSNYVIHHYDKDNKYIGKDSIVFIKDEVIK